MSGFVFHPEALADLEEVWEYIAADNLKPKPGMKPGDRRNVSDTVLRSAS